MGKQAKSAVADATTASSNVRTEPAAMTPKQQLQHLKLDPRGDGMYSGTFRWLESKHFPRLPDIPHAPSSPSSSVASASATAARQLSSALRESLEKGWEGYLAARSDATTDLVAAASQDPSCLDALSFPITLAYVAQRLSLWDPREREKHVLVLGASSKAEQCIWRITEYWHELALLFPHTAITLWFIGPEVQEHDQRPVRATPRFSTLRARHFRGTFGAFRDTHASHDCTPQNTLVVGFNTGFGNFVDSQRHDLLFSWLPDLRRVADSRIPALFTCANDYADMTGEFAVQSRVVGAALMLLPQQNPFSCASHLHEEGRRETAWSRGNSFLYVVRGADLSRRVHIAAGDVASLHARLDAELDLHLEDALGRHFFRGVVLSKEQAARCKALAVVADTAAGSSSSSPKEERQQVALETPQLQLRQGRASNEVVALVHVPKVRAASERIAVDVSDSMLSVFVPDKYLLRATLPFAVSDDAVVRAELALPFLHVTLRRQ